MREISEEESSKIIITGSGQGRRTIFYSAIIGLHVGKSLFVSKGEWNRYRTPSRMCRYIEKKYKEMKIKYTCCKCKIDDESGWLIKRMG